MNSQDYVLIALKLKYGPIAFSYANAEGGGIISCMIVVGAAKEMQWATKNNFILD